MASTIVVHSSFLFRGKASTLTNIRKSPVLAFADIAAQNQTTSASNQSTIKCRRRAVAVAKAVGENPESSSLSVVNTVKSVAIDKLPVLPTIFEIIGIFVSSWFIYRYLLFKPDREELSKIVKCSISEILGQ